MKHLNSLLLLCSILLSSTLCYTQDFIGNSRIRSENYQIKNNEEWKNSVNSTSLTRLGIGWNGEDILGYKWSMNVTGNYFYEFQDGEEDNNSSGEPSLYEASISTQLPYDITLEAGRMPLHYGDGRIIGNDNWGNRGRSHDGVILKYKGFINIDIGTDVVESNQNKDWAYIYINRNTEEFNLDGAYLIANARNTMGIALDFKTMEDQLDIGFDYWNQTWYKTANVDNKDETAALIAITINYNINEKISLGGGIDMFSETNGGKWNSTWGDYHQFNGAMDIVANNMDGTWNDTYFNIKYKMEGWDIGLTYHAIASEKNELLGGDEIDIFLTNKLNKHINYGIGISQLTPNDNGDESRWMYLQVAVTP